MVRAARWIALFAVLSPFIAGRADAAGRLTVGDGPDLVIEVGDVERTARWSAAGLSGANARLVRRGSSLQGTVDRVDVSLRWTTGRVEGTLGRLGVVDFFVGHSGGRPDVEGRIGEEVANLSIGPSRIAGPLGPCTFSLRADGGDYEGFALCGVGQVPMPVRVQLPSSLTNETPAAIGAFLAATLVPTVTSVSPPFTATATQLSRPAVGRGVGPRRPPPAESRLGLSIQDSEQGPVVSNVVAGGVAARSGLDEGMRILRVGREDVKSAEQVRRALRIVPRGADLVLEVVAPGASEELRSFRSLRVP